MNKSEDVFVDVSVVASASRMDAIGAKTLLLEWMPEVLRILLTESAFIAGYRTLVCLSIAVQEIRHIARKRKKR